MTKKKLILSARNLKSILWDTLQGLQSKKIDTAKADAIAMQSREIVRVINSQQSILRYASKKATTEMIDYATK